MSIPPYLVTLLQNRLDDCNKSTTTDPRVHILFENSSTLVELASATIQDRIGRVRHILYEDSDNDIGYRAPNTPELQRITLQFGLTNRIYNLRKDLYSWKNSVEDFETSMNCVQETLERQETILFQSSIHESLLGRILTRFIHLTSKLLDSMPASSMKQIHVEYLCDAINESRVLLQAIERSPTDITTLRNAVKILSVMLSYRILDNIKGRFQTFYNKGNHEKRIIMTMDARVILSLGSHPSPLFERIEVDARIHFWNPTISNYWFDNYGRWWNETE